MSDLAVNVAWQEVVRETEAGNIPHCRAISAPLKWHEDIATELARLILGSYRTGHPDFLMAGTPGKPPKIDECRELIDNIALKPMEAPRRLGVIMSADKLLLPAANSLLKLAEEPPEHACLLFLMEDVRFFLPTLRSRSRLSMIASDERITPRKMPEDSPGWLEWLRDSRKPSTDAETIASELEAWADYEREAGNIGRAEKTERLRIIAGRKNLSVPMFCDMIILSLREDNKEIERLLDDFR